MQTYNREDVQLERINEIDIDKDDAIIDRALVELNKAKD